MREKYGFVYIWFDRKHKRFYIGSHWGFVDDGYVCSSSWMKQAYERRPGDFKRRVVKTNIPRENILTEEQRWLSKIPKDQLGKRYYNLKNDCLFHWTADPGKRLTVGQKISKANTGRKVTWAKPLTEEHKQKLSAYWKGKPKNYTRTKETRAKISDNNKRLQAEGRIGMSGKQHSEATKQKMSQNNAMNNPINRQKVIDAKKGIRWLINGTTKKMATPGTEKFNELLSLGYKVRGELC
jgi:hypothetical protein